MRYLLAVALFLFVLSLAAAFSELEEVEERPADIFVESHDPAVEDELNPLEKRWCGFYNFFKKGCCDSKTYVRKTHACCGKKVYHKKTEGCHDEKVFKKKTHEFCGKKVIKKKTQGCCKKGNKAKAYKKRWRKCCKGKVRYWFYICRK